MSLAPMKGLSLSQAPPLSTVASFFLTGPVFALLAGLLLAVRGAATLTQPFSSETLALTHLVTLGFLANVMMGALYQMTPVVVGEPVPRVRLAHLVHLAFNVGVVCLVAGVGLASTALVWAAIAVLGPALLLFVAPVAVALWRAETRSATARGMRFAVLCLVLLATLGLWMAHGHAGASFPGERKLFVDAHASLALYGWLATLLIAVSWQVVPMFYLAEEVDGRARGLVHGLVALGALTPPVGLLLWQLGVNAPAVEALIRYGSAPAVLGALALHPWLTLRSLRRRKRKRVDVSRGFWQAAMGLAPLVALLALADATLASPRVHLLFGLSLLWGWAGLVMHGMLGRIVSFLVWFHRFSPLAGLQPIPSMRSLLPDARARRGLWLHVASLFTLGAGVAFEADTMIRLGGALMASTALWLLLSLVAILRRRPDPAPTDAGLAAS